MSLLDCANWDLCLRLGASSDIMIFNELVKPDPKSGNRLAVVVNPSLYLHITFVHKKLKPAANISSLV